MNTTIREGADGRQYRKAVAPGRLWLMAAAVATLGNLLLFDAEPGLNWVIWVAAASAGLVAVARWNGTATRPVMVTGAAALLIAGAASVTTAPVITVFICGAVILYLAMQMLLAAGLTWGSLTARFAITAPFVAFGRAVTQTLIRAVEATNLVRSPTAGAGLRGIAITLPILVVFALLLSMADPVFAGWRISIESQFTNLDFIPRIIFFVALLTASLGAYGYAAREHAAPGLKGRGSLAGRWVGSTELLILMGGVAGLFWLFLALQLSYLFGNAPESVGSGVTFAEYARRGFAELTVVASAATGLVILAELLGPRDDRRGTLRILILTVLVAVFLLLASAIYRVVLYEQAYGFTVPRLYGKTYMIAVALGLVALCVEVAGDFDGNRLFRRALGVVTLLFIALAWWNHEGWIAGRNIERYATTGRLDTAYLAQELSAGAIPAIGARLGTLPEPARSELVAAVRANYERRAQTFDRRWYEWNLATERARESLVRDFGVHPPG